MVSRDCSSQLGRPEAIQPACGYMVARAGCVDQVKASQRTMRSTTLPESWTFESEKKIEKCDKTVTDNEGNGLVFLVNVFLSPFSL